MMRKAILRRTAAGIATLFLVSILVFIGTSVLPGDVAQILLGQMATPETLAALRAKLGLDQPAHIRYFQWLGDLLSGDLGISKAGGSTISSIIQGRLSNTVWLAALVALIAIPVSLALGLLTAMYPGTRLDRTVTFCTLSLISVPEFLVATCLVLILAVHLRWLPSIAYMSGNETGWQLIKAMAMPILTLVIVVSAQIIRMTRATVLNVMSSPYIEMAILKGVPRRRIILRHALRNAMGAFVNVIALNMAWLISGIVIVETIFAYPGLAKLMIDAVQIRDLPLVQAIAMIFCTSYVVLIFVADMASILSNPRIRHPK